MRAPRGCSPGSRSRARGSTLTARRTAASTARTSPAPRSCSATRSRTAPWPRPSSTCCRASSAHASHGHGARGYTPRAPDAATRNARRMFDVGTQIGPYVVRNRLGAGGMGEVYLAYEPRLEREVALKMLPRDLARDPERLARFRHEALALASLNNPNIAIIHGFEELMDGSLALVLERVEGES